MNKIGLMISSILIISGSLLLRAETVISSSQTVPAKNTAVPTGRQSPFLLNLSSLWIRENGRVEGAFSKAAKDGRDASATIGVEWTSSTLCSLMIIADDDVQFSHNPEESDGIQLWLAGKKFFFNDRAYILSGKKWEVCPGIKMKMEIIKKPMFFFPRGYSIMLEEIPPEVLGWKNLSAQDTLGFNVVLQDVDKNTRGKILWAEKSGWLTPGKQAIFHLKK